MFGTLTPNTRSGFELACTIDRHYEAGMPGFIVVSGKLEDGVPNEHLAPLLTKGRV